MLGGPPQYVEGLIRASRRSALDEDPLSLADELPGGEGRAQVRGLALLLLVGKGCRKGATAASPARRTAFARSMTPKAKG